MEAVGIGDGSRDCGASDGGDGEHYLRLALALLLGEHVKGLDELVVAELGGALGLYLGEDQVDVGAGEVRVEDLGVLAEFHEVGCGGGGGGGGNGGLEIGGAGVEER